MPVTYAQIKKATLGKSYDVDGYYGAQCWDFIMYVAKTYYNGKVISCTSTGYVKDIANNKNSNGILSFCKDVTSKGIAQAKSGDIVVWTNCSATPYSHIALFDSKSGSTYYFLGQNQAGHAYVDVQAIATSGIIGIFRPNVLNTSTSTTSTTSTTSSKAIPSGFTAQTGTFTVTVSAINVRTAPSTSSGKVVATYSKGQSVNYDSYKAEANGYCWISYISTSGVRRYMVCGTTNAARVNTQPWGTFK